MTLDIPQFIANSIRNQSKIHHLDINVKATAKDKVPKSVISLITKDYGEKYLNDADYVAFFWGAITKEHIEKLFNVVDKALGKSANRLTDKDFKKIDFKPEHNDDAEDDEVEDVEVEEDIVDDNDEDDNTSDDAAGEEDEETENDADKLNEDDEEELEVDATVEEKPSVPTSYFFLKITLK